MQIRRLFLALFLFIVSFGIMSPVEAKRGDCHPYARSNAVIKIMSYESDGDPYADNPRSTAFGCGQMLISNRIRYARQCSTFPGTTDPADQMCMMHNYIDDRFGSDGRALAFRLRNGYY